MWWKTKRLEDELRFYKIKCEVLKNELDLLREENEELKKENKKLMTFIDEQRGDD